MYIYIYGVHNQVPVYHIDNAMYVHMCCRYWNASFCGSGDHTLAAAVHAIHEVTQEEGDDYFVFVLSVSKLRGMSCRISSYLSNVWVLEGFMSIDC